MRMRPRAPPLRFWKSKASATCSRLTLPILVSTRPMGRFSSSLIGGIAGADGDPASGPEPGVPAAAPEPGVPGAGALGATALGGTAPFPPAGLAAPLVGAL